MESKFIGCKDKSSHTQPDRSKLYQVENMSNLTKQTEPIVKRLLKAEEEQLYEKLGILKKAIKADPKTKDLLDPPVTYNEAKMGRKEEILELGKNIFNRWAVETYKLTCGSEDADLEDRKKLITTTGVSEVAIASGITSLLITELTVPAALAPVIAAIAVKRFFRPAYEEFCSIWKKNLSEISNMN